MTNERRGTIFLEDAEILSQQAFDAQQFVLRVQAPRCAAKARPGTFAHISCDPSLPMRRPLSIMRASPAKGWVEFLYKIVGDGLALLSQRRAGEQLSIMGPIGQPFRPSPARPRPLLLGGGVGIPPMVFLAEQLARDKGTQWQPLVLMGSEIPFPFRARPSTLLLPGVPADAIACMPLIESWDIPCRLASAAGLPGCYSGFVTELADEWLQNLGSEQRADVEIFACGPTPMLAAAAALARRHGVPCQVSLEEFMACATGGCAGCAVRIETPDGPAMKRVCVDGPVFDAYAVFPAA